MVAKKVFQRTGLSLSTAKGVRSGCAGAGVAQWRQPALTRFASVLNCDRMGHTHAAISKPYYFGGLER